MCLGKANLVRRTAPPNLKRVSLLPADTPVDAHIAGSGRSRPVTTGESAMWTDNPGEGGGRDLVLKERAGFRHYSARLRDGLYPVGVSSSSLNFSGSPFTEIDELHGFRLVIHRMGDAKSR